jgi:hypothetical protein
MTAQTRIGRRIAVGTAATAALAALGAGVAFAVTPFTDVPAGHPHERGIDYVADTGITAGCTSTTYCPSNPVTRGQMATFLHRASGNDPATAPSVNADTLDGQHARDLLPAAVHVTRGAGNAPVVDRFSNLTNGAAPTIVQFGSGYDLTFGFDVSGTFPQCSIDTNFVDTRDALCTVSVPSANIVRVRVHDISVGGFAPAEFWLTLHG